MDNNDITLSNDKIKKSGEYERFDDIDFLTENVDLLKGIFYYGFSTPSRIQALTLEPMHNGKDILAQSQSGTGKTGAFVISALSRITTTNNFPQVLIISNTKDLSSQIFNVASEIGKFMGIQLCLCIGGTLNKKDDVMKSHLIVGTPGRLNELISTKKWINAKKLKILILDEADELLKDDFSSQIKSIITELDQSSQICVFSATFPEKILEITKKFLNEPVEFLLEKEKLSLDLIRQYKVDVQYEKHKYSTLKDLYGKLRIGQCMIFVNFKERAEMLKKSLIEDGHSCGMIHGDIPNKDRNDELKKFRLGETRVLISTDILSRGIDVEQIGLVINYDMPTDISQYLHRIGRSGRYGKIGIAINIITINDYDKITNVEKYYDIKINNMISCDAVNSILSGVGGHLTVNKN
jgi:ATP-dependent RNA helicase